MFKKYKILIIIFTVLNFTALNSACAQQATKLYYKAILSCPEQDNFNSALGLIKINSFILANKNKYYNSSNELLLKANSDYANILAILQNYGFFGSTISISINGEEIADINPNKKLPQDNVIIIKINPGPLYHMGKISVQGGLSDDFNLKTNDIAKSNEIKKIAINLIKKLQDQGYANAKILQEEILADDANRLVNFYLKIEAGKKIYLEKIHVVNNSPVKHIKEQKIIELSGFTRHMLLTPDLLDSYHENLEQLDLFSSIIITHRESANSDKSTLELNVIEKPLHNINIGISYDTKDGIGSNLNWMHRNLSNYGDHLKIKINANNVNTKNNIRTYDSQYELQYDYPGFLSYDSHFLSILNGKIDKTVNYKSNQLEIKVGSYKNLSHNWLGSSYIDFSRIYDKTEVFGERYFNILSLDNNLNLDLRDNNLEPHRGFYFNILYRPFIEIKRHYLAHQLEAEGRSYLAFDPSANYVLALRAKYSTILGTNLSNIPSDMQYFIGGSTTLRGFKYRSIGLEKYINNQKYILGGRSFAAASLELRSHLFGKFGAVAFIDTAVLGSDIFPQNSAYFGAGIGARYISPIGPLRFDIAVPLNKKNVKDKFQFYIGLGESF